MVLVFFSLMITDIEHVFTCLLASLEKSLFRSFAHFLIGSFVILVLSFASSLYNLEINYLYDVLLNMFSSSVGCLFILLMVSFTVQKLCSLM